MVDEGRVSRLLRALAERVRRLEAAGGQAAGNRDALWLDAVKYVFVTAIEACVDVAQHIGASEKFPAPDSNAAALRALGERGVIDTELADSLARAVGFRNVLVHQYVDVDDQVVIDALGRLDEFEQFVHQVSRWMVGGAGSGGEGGI